MLKILEFIVVFICVWGCVFVNELGVENGKEKFEVENYGEWCLCTYWVRGFFSDFSLDISPHSSNKRWGKSDNESVS